MKFRVSALAVAYIFLWGLNSYATPEAQQLPEVRPAAVEWETHLIPLMVINGELVDPKDLINKTLSP